jgi:hypothetical protein
MARPGGVPSGTQSAIDESKPVCIVDPKGHCWGLKSSASGGSCRLFPQEGRPPGFGIVHRRGSFDPCVAAPLSFMAHRPENTGVLLHGSIEMHVSTRRLHRSGLPRFTPPTMPSADFSAAITRLTTRSARAPGHGRNRLRRTPAGFTTRPLMGADFAITCSPVRPGRPCYPVFVHRAADLLHASFRPRLATTPLRFANPSPPSGWIEDFHLQTLDHARHTAKRAPAMPEPRFGESG